MTVPWLIGVARHKLVDHWRRLARDERRLQMLTGAPPPVEDPWEAQIDADSAHETLQAIAPQYRAALTLRYLDDLPVAEVGGVLLGRGPPVHRGRARPGPYGLPAGLRGRRGTRMTDPFPRCACHRPPSAPDPAFTAQLRSRLQRAFDLPKGVTVSNLTIEHTTERSALASTRPAAGAAGLPRRPSRPTWPWRVQKAPCGSTPMPSERASTAIRSSCRTVGSAMPSSTSREPCSCSPRSTRRSA